MATVDDSQPSSVIRITGGGLTASISTLGASILQLYVPGRNGRLDDVVLGCSSLQEYANGTSPYFGAIVGRCANRIAKAEYKCPARACQVKLEANDGENSLHGGFFGFHRQIWTVTDQTASAVTLEHKSEDGDAGYPNALSVAVTYELVDSGALSVKITATVEKSDAKIPTPVNIAQHSYFNLEGHGYPSILEHQLYINGVGITPVDPKSLIPTGNIATFDENPDLAPFDFRVAKPIGRDIDKTESGYDHNYVVHDMRCAPARRLVARVTAPRSGRVMEVFSNAPGVQFYSGNFLDGKLCGKDGVPYGKHSGFCLETQSFPDTPNQATTFPSVFYYPGESYVQDMLFRFRLSQ